MFDKALAISFTSESSDHYVWLITEFENVNWKRRLFDRFGAESAHMYQEGLDYTGSFDDYEESIDKIEEALEFFEELDEDILYSINEDTIDEILGEI
jgi:hypothetical protein